MKTRILIFSVLMILLLNGCIVKSLHRFYHEEDVIYDEAILGTWVDEDYTRWVISQYTFGKGFMQADSTDNSYLVELYEDSLAPVQFNVHMFEVEGKKYLDFMPLRDNGDYGLLDMHLVSTHSLAMVDYDKAGNVTISWFAEEWLSSLFEENRVKIAHEVVKNPGINTDTFFVLTASTNELQKFIKKYGNRETTADCDKNDHDHFMCTQLKKVN